MRKIRIKRVGYLSFGLGVVDRARARDGVDVGVGAGRGGVVGEGGFSSFDSYLQTWYPSYPSPSLIIDTHVYE